MKSDTYQVIAAYVGNMVTDKNKAYGDSFAKTGEFLSLLFPTGIPPAKYSAALAIVRVFDKIMRISAAPAEDDPMGEDPWLDIAGYAILALSNKHSEART